jgi:hypothetical protein
LRINSGVFLFHKFSIGLNQTKTTKETTMKNALIAILMIASASAPALTLATTPPSVEVWEGPGTLFSAEGKELASYGLTVTNTKSGNKIHSAVAIKLPDGTVKQQSCEITDSGKEGWQSECTHGKGGGRCFGEGLCVSYEEDGLGGAFATNIVMDGPKDMRLLRTQLNKGKAVLFFREKLQK